MEFPKPSANDYFNINQRSTKIVIYNILGNIVQTHKGNFSSGYRFDVSALKSDI